MVASSTPSKVLVVEDEKVARQALVMLLEYEGYEVRSASGGDEAIQLVSEWAPDVVVSDVNMPRGDGFSLVPALRGRSDCVDAAILLVSARDDIDRRVNGLDLGADDFLSKPVDPEELLARIRAHLRNSQRRKELKMSSTLDECSGLLNRRGLDEILGREVGRAERGTKFSILLIDLDDFKSINDRWGHAVGDQVLRQVSRSLEAASRSADRSGRWGGDEFLVVLSGCVALDAKAAIRRFRSQIEQILLTPDGGEIRVACSIGSATYEAGLTTAEIIARADHAMYEDKERRRQHSKLH